MPALLHYPRQAASSLSADTRAIDARQLGELAHDAARSIVNAATHLTQRLPQLRPRQSGGIVAIPAVYQGLKSGPAPFAVVLITLGSIVGFLLLLGLFWMLRSGGGVFRTNTYEEEDVVVRRRSRSPRSRRSHRTEMTDRSPRRERIIRQERITREIPRQQEPSVMDPPYERRVEGDDIVEV